MSRNIPIPLNLSSIIPPTDPVIFKPIWKIKSITNTDGMVIEPYGSPVMPIFKPNSMVPFPEIS